MLCTIISLLLFTPVYTQDNISGQWQGVFYTDMSYVHRPFFLNMILRQDGKKVEGRFSNSIMDLQNEPHVVYEISGLIGKKDKIPSRLMVGKIIYNMLPEGVAEVFLQFDEIHYFRNDTMEVLFGNWLPNSLGMRRSDGVGGSFWVRKLQRTDTLQKETVVTPDLPPYQKSETAVKKTDSLQIPEQMVKRKNTEQGRLAVNTKNITLSLYDNGIADGDTVSVFLNGKLLLSHQRVSEKPIVINIELDENAAVNEIVLFAENLGRIPPNTTLVVVTVGNKRYELFSKADLTENAVLVFEYQPK